MPLLGIRFTDLPLPLNDAFAGVVPDPLTEVDPVLMVLALPPIEPAAAADPVVFPEPVPGVPVLPAVSPWLLVPTTGVAPNTVEFAAVCASTGVVAAKAATAAAMQSVFM
ncbi:MAG: hypothetical protein ABI212_14455 [Burkholderiaceae bacterium]